ncbi:MAG: amidohydrolase family protein [Planctomycetota bacterium]
MTKLLQLAVLIAVSLTPAFAADETPLVLHGARLLTMGPAGNIEAGVVVVQGGKIVAIGASDEIAIPANAETRDLAGKLVMPGLVDTHSHVGGGSGGDGADPIQPDVRVLDSLNARSAGIQRAQAGGITVANVMPGSGHLCSGQTLYIKYRDGRTIDDLLLHDAEGNVLGGLKMANGTNPMRSKAPFPGTRAKSAALVRQTFVRAQEYRAKLEAAADDDEQDPPARDLGLEALVEALEGTRIVHHHTHRHDDILTVLRLADEFGFRVVLHHVSEGWKVAEEIAARNVPCSIIVIDAPGGKLEARDLRLETGAVLERAGVQVAFHTDDWITDSRHFLRSAALAVRAGMTRQKALEALTIEPARMLDLADRVGSLEVGKDADFIVLDGDPLSIYTKVEETWIDGAKVFDRKRPQDRLWATGGFGAGHDANPGCCARQDWWR